MNFGTNIDGFIIFFDILSIICTRQPSARLLARILKVGVQILCGPKAHIALCRSRHAPRGVWGHAPPENVEKLKPLRRDFRDSGDYNNICSREIVLASWKAHAVALPLPHFHCRLHCHFH